MVIFQPARAKSSKVASCKLPLGIPSFKRLIALPPERRLCPDQMCVPRRCGRSRFLRSEEHTSELQSHLNLVCRLLLEKKKKKKNKTNTSLIVTIYHEAVVWIS